MHYFFAASLISAYALTRLAERRMHRANYNFLIFAGGEERDVTMMQWFYRIGYISFPFIMAEFLIRGGKIAATPVAFSCLLAILLTLHIRIWAMRSLGRQWSMRLVFVSGYPKIARGPYRFIAHPEYLARFIEAFAVGLFFRAYICMGLFSLVYSLFLRRILRSEKQQLLELSMPQTN